MNKKLTILGVNGWKKRGHDASACLIVDNKILTFVEEERFIRKRYSYDVLPIHAIRYCLENNNISLKDIDIIAFGWDKPAIYKEAELEFPYKNEIDLFKDLFPFNLKDLNFSPLPKIVYVPHHISHAASSYRVSGFEESSILVLDGQGETESGGLGFSKNGKIEFFKKFPIKDSLGYFVEAGCAFIGLKPSDAGKLMGLAAHGNPIYDFPEIFLEDDGYCVNGFNNSNENKKELDKQKAIHNFWIENFSTRFPEWKVERNFQYSNQKGKVQEELIISQFSKDFSASVQKKLEDVILHLVTILIKQTGLRKISYAGGVALNCLTNARILNENYAEDLYIQPAANDAGVSLGAALETAFSTNNTAFSKMDHAYWGNVYSDEQIKSELDRLKIKYEKFERIDVQAAEALNEGKVVAWFQGKMEIGPRALGSRSILANPKLKEMHKLLNIIKSREQWRPLAPSIISDKANDYFEKCPESPFMLITGLIKDSKVLEIPAVAHVDKSARYQSVKKDTNQIYYSLIEEFEKLSGTPMVLNTSFNIEGEPIVNTPEQAIKTFYASQIDCLAIGNYWITK